MVMIDDSGLNCCSCTLLHPLTKPCARYPSCVRAGTGCAVELVLSRRLFIAKNAAQGASVVPTCPVVTPCRSRRESCCCILSLLEP